jgi:hypothetical protein
MPRRYFHGTVRFVSKLQGGSSQEPDRSAETGCAQVDIGWNYHRYSEADPARLPFPHMTWAFDPDAVRGVIASLVPRLMPGSRLRVVDVYHRPAKSLDICYAIGDRQVDQSAVTLRFSTTERGGHAFRKARKRVANPQRLFEVDHTCFGWVFPEDTELPDLERFLAEPGEPHAHNILSYRRGSRAALRVAAPEPSVVKVYPRAQAHHARLTALFNTPDRQFGMAEPLPGYRDLMLRREQYLEGAGFERHAAVKGLRDTVALLFAALTSLHRLNVKDLPEFKPSEMIERFHMMFLRRLDLSGSRALELCIDLGKLLIQNAPAPSRTMKTLHGDLHSGNVIFAASAPALIDLDEMILGDVEYDIAVLGSQFILMSELAEGENDYLQLACELPEIYRSVSGWHVENSRYAWYLAALLASRQIKSCITQACPDHEPISDRLARMALVLARDLRGTVDVLKRA